jgi:multidrug efflux pump subunit AcrA (membrane-fusion protein)
VREFEGRYFVIVQDGESQRRVDVEVGIIEPNRIEILDGLIEGQVVVAP